MRASRIGPADWYEDQSVDLLLGVSAVGLEPAERRLALSDGTTLRYEQLLICTGCSPTHASGAQRLRQRLGAPHPR